jgi:dolichyl-phosphate-mannose--protein O-mannosyl transferase
MFVIAGYVLYLATWAAIPRYHFLYHYLPSLYLGFLALAAILTDCWSGVAKICQQCGLLAAALLPIFAPFGLLVGLAVSIVVILTYCLIFSRRSILAGKFVVILFSAATLLGFVYFLPLWVGTPLSRSQFAQHLWLRGPGLANWF